MDSLKTSTNTVKDDVRSMHGWYSLFSTCCLNTNIYFNLYDK